MTCDTLRKLKSRLVLHRLGHVSYLHLSRFLSCAIPWAFEVSRSRFPTPIRYVAEKEEGISRANVSWVSSSDVELWRDNQARSANLSVADCNYESSPHRFRQQHVRPCKWATLDYNAGASIKTSGFRLLSRPILQRCLQKRSPCWSCINRPGSGGHFLDSWWSSLNLQ